jgi:3',5'-cyclic AMP phosphodiesterase CpdA
MRRLRFLLLLIVGIVLIPATLLSVFHFAGQQERPASAVRAIAPPKRPLPPEEMSAGVSKFSFIVYGDTRGRRDGVELQYEHSLVADSVIAMMKRLGMTDYPVRFIMQTGDAVVDGGNAGQWNTSFVDVINRLTTEGGVPYFLAPGNHDVSAADNLAAPQRQQSLRNYLAAMAQLIPPNNAQRRLAEYPTYAFGYGNTFVVALDSNIANDEVQYEWVKNQLEGLNRSRYVNVVALFHHPVFSSGPHGASKLEPPSAGLRARYMPLFRTHHVKLIFAGHDHLFEHWVERYTDSTGRHRIDLVTTAGGGAPLYSYQGEPDLTAYLKTNDAAKVQVEHLAKPGVSPGENPYHYVIVRVDGERIDLDVIGVDWGISFQPYRSNRVELRDVTR